jgi:hypothetical protein
MELGRAFLIDIVDILPRFHKITTMVNLDSKFSQLQSYNNHNSMELAVKVQNSRKIY